MPLSKQLGLSFLVVLLLVFVSALWINVSSTRAFIEQQLSSHAQDTATSLGLSIAPHIGIEEDIPVIDTMTNSIFDSGYYKNISLTDNNNNTIIEKSNPSTLEAVPTWFQRLFPLSPPTQMSEISTGWNIAGTVAVSSNPGMGYTQLWENAVGTFWMVLTLFIISLVIVWFLVKSIMTPINAAVKQAKAIEEKKFDTITVIPKMRELKVFVNALNSMTAKLSSMFTQITQQAEEYRQYAYIDSLTNTENRRSFELSFSRMLNDEEHQSHGFLAIVRLASLADINHHLGTEIADNYITNTCTIIKRFMVENNIDMSLFRLNGADFVLIIEDIDQTKCEKLIDSLSIQLLASEKSEYSNGTAHIGVSHYEFGENRSLVIERADSALAIASTQHNCWHIASSSMLVQGNKAWREQIQRIIKQGTSSFASQPILNRDGEELYSEWFARLPNEHSSGNFPMAQLIPASVRLDYSNELDQMIFKAALQQLVHHKGVVGLNISRVSLLDDSFHEWLINNLPQDKTLLTRLVLEIPERALVNSSNKLVVHINRLKALGIRITVERFGAQLAGLIHLREIRPHFLKLDGRFISNIHNEPDNQLFVKSLISIAHGLDILVIAERVETLDESQWLTSANVDYQQGYYVCAPQTLVSG